MPNTNSPAGAQTKTLLDKFKQANEKFKNYLGEVDRKIVELDLKYAKNLVKHDINVLRAAKSVLLNRKK